MGLKLISSFLLGLLVCSAACAADDYPSRIVRIVVPFASGGSADLLTRSVAQRLDESWRQPVVVENRAGGGGIAGSVEVMRAAPDGYTLLVGTVTTHAVSAALYSKPPFDPQRDFDPIIEFAHIAQLLLVHPSSAAHSVKQLIAIANESPGTLKYGTAGPGSVSHMAMELFQSMGKVKMVHVPYQGAGPALADLLSGKLSVTFDIIMTSLPHIRSGKLRALGISSLQRSSIMPEVPTIAEAGYPGYEAVVWFGLFAPAGTPPELIRRINEDTARALLSSRTRDVLAAQGVKIVASSHTAFGDRVSAEIAKWTKVVQGARIKLDR
jgi:tripartite-type tricarboxylate transporter receptor subunit TctC